MTDTIILFELAPEGEEVIRLREKHYRLVDRREISPDELTLCKTLQLD